jgi:hypothetical protein
MAVFTGYVALGTGVSAGVFQEVSGGSYARLAIALTGTAGSGLTQNLGAFVAATAPAGGMQSYGAFFDASTAGNLLAYWQWNVPVPVGTLYPATTLNIQFFDAVSAEMFQGGDTFVAGQQLGTLNGMPFIAGSTLITDGSGNIKALPYTVINVGSGGVVFMAPGGVRLAHIDGSGNLVQAGTASTTAGTP